MSFRWQAGPDLDTVCPGCRAPTEEPHSFCIDCGDRFYLAWCREFPIAGRPSTLAEVVGQREARERRRAARGARRPYTAGDFRTFLGRAAVRP